MARVLLAAEDAPESSRTIARLALEATGHTVEEVHDGQSVLAQVAATHPDVLALDSSLPGLDGFQVLDRLRRHPTLRHLPVVMLSTLPRSIGGELARSLGVVHFLVRPFTAAELDEAIATALAPAAPGSARTPGAAPLPAAAVASSAAWLTHPAVPEAGTRRAAQGATRRLSGATPRHAAGAPTPDEVVELPPSARRRASASRRPLRRA